MSYWPTTADHPQKLFHAELRTSIVSALPLLVLELLAFMVVFVAVSILVPQIPFQQPTLTWCFIHCSAAVP